MLKDQIASAFARLVAAINAVNTKVDNLPNSSILPELANDPTNANESQRWVKRTLLAEQGSLQGFFGAYPVQHLADVNRFDLSVQTSDGVRRVELK